MIEEKIEALLQEKFLEPDFSDCFLLEIKASANQKIEVFIDADSGITFEKCQKISRHLEEHIDAQGWLGERYTLEVSSPGVSRPLALWRQYPRNIGRNVEVTLEDKSVRTGTLHAVTPDTVVLQEEVKTKEGKKTKKEIVETVIPFSHIVKTVVKVSF
ncbi:MAG: ribosome maturation factor RimP [Haliscomenobacter sp.]